MIYQWLLNNPGFALPAIFFRQIKEYPSKRHDQKKNLFKNNKKKSAEMPVCTESGNIYPLSNYNFSILFLVWPQFQLYLQTFLKVARIIQHLYSGVF